MSCISTAQAKEEDGCGMKAAKATVAGVVTSAGVTQGLTALGFTATGITGGSVVAGLQSVAATGGLIMTGPVGIGAAVVGGSLYYMFGCMKREVDKRSHNIPSTANSGTKEEDEGYGTRATKAVKAAVAGVATSAVVTQGLAGAGFTATGIAGGSVVAGLQSVAATGGLIMTGPVGIGAALVGGSLYYIFGYEGYGTRATEAVKATAAGVATSAVVTQGLAGAGFTATGIAGGSVVAGLQSLGATGSLAITGPVGIGVGVVGVGAYYTFCKRIKT